LSHLPRTRPPVGHRGRAEGHAGRRARRELQDPLARGRPRHVALSLPRRGPHDERDDRDLPGDAVTRLSAIVAVAFGLAAASASAADAPPRDVTMPGKLFEPARITILTGTTVTWHNSDATNHTVTADGDAFDSGYIGPGATFSYTFAKQGHYAYHCTIHKF